MMIRVTLLCTLILVYIAGCASQATLQYEQVSNGVQSLTLQKPLEADETLSHLYTPEGFEVKVFAAEPDIQNPIAFSWDEKGRLWVVESTNYPHEYIGTERGTDRITICEDTNGDGVADRFIRFAENQPLSTAIAVVKGGALVGQAPDIVFMEDTDGDDKYDRKTPVLDDTFGSFDTHAVMNNFKYGIDNHIWSAVGYSGMYNPGEAPPPGERTNQDERILPMGVFRFSRDGSYLEPVGRFNNNTWGLGIGEDNTIFGSTANNNHAVVVGIPMRYESEMNVANVQSHFLVEHSATTPPQQVDFRDGYTAAAGAFLYNGRKYPKKYWNALMVTEPTAHIVLAGFMEPNGAIFREKEGHPENFLASSDDWVAPVFADIGPDENIWIADWYNPVIQHNPDRRGMRNQVWNADRGPGNAHLNPLRDTEHGRIYILEYTGATPSNPITSIDPNDDAALIAGLKSTNQFWRLTAQRLIIENDKKSLIAELILLAEDESVDEMGLNAPAVHALWTLHGLGVIGDLSKTVTKALMHKSAAVRKAAIEVSPHTESANQALIAANVFEDQNLNTRLAAVLNVIDRGEKASTNLRESSKKALPGADEWVIEAINILHPTTQTKMEVSDKPAPSQGSLPTAYLTVNANPEFMSFQQTTLQAYADQPIQLTFNNLHPDLHNVVLLDQGVDVEAFGKAVDDYLTDPDAAENDYVPPAYKDQILASTGVLSLDEVSTVEIAGLPKGEYVYICTVPGHWMVMQGVLRVE